MRVPIGSSKSREIQIRLAIAFFQAVDSRAGFESSPPACKFMGFGDRKFVICSQAEL
jgi:hypothetical protein